MKRNLEFGQFTTEHYDKLIEGLRLYNTNNFWLCHEFVEDLWMDYIGDDARYVFWVIIQVATCLYHLEDQNMNGAAGMINKAKRKIEIIEKRHVESYILDEKLDWQKFKALVVSIPKEPSFSDFDKLKNFKFKLEL